MRSIVELRQGGRDQRGRRVEPWCQSPVNDLFRRIWRVRLNMAQWGGERRELGTCVRCWRLEETEERLDTGYTLWWRISRHKNGKENEGAAVEMLKKGGSFPFTGASLLFSIRSFFLCHAELAGGWIKTGRARTCQRDWKVHLLISSTGLHSSPLASRGEQLRKQQKR